MLLESYVEQINKFVGKEVIKATPMPKKVSQDVFDFLADLCDAINRHTDLCDAINRHKWQVHCVRKCPFRKAEEEQ